MKKIQTPKQEPPVGVTKVCRQKQFILSPSETSDEFDVSPLMSKPVKPFFISPYGALFDGDCVKILPLLNNDTIDTVFADPPFNLGKQYGKKTNDNIPDVEYIAWCKKWLAECVRVLKPGGALFVYNLPKWNIPLGAYLSELEMQFRHWIAVEISACLPIAGRLHPSHYSLLYYTKGKPKTFRRIRTPVITCRHCGGEVKDYGGHRKALNPNGLTLKDVWTDIPPVRHWKFKSKNRTANALSTKLVNRVIQMTTLPGDLVLDPFGGSGTTFDCCERTERRWIGIEIDYAKEIRERLLDDDIKPHPNTDFVED